MRDRFGAVLTASASVLSVEAVLAVIALFVWGQTQEVPDASYAPMGIFLLVLAAPFVAAAGAALTALVSAAVVLPLLAASASLGRRLLGREAWWWVPVSAAAASAPPVLAVAAPLEAGSPVGIGGWLAVTAALAVPALVARRLLLPNRPWLTGGAMFGRVALYGAVAVVGACLLAAAGLYAGIGYEPPRLDTERVAGTWSDGKGGTLVLTAGGKAMATRVRTFDVDDSVEPVVRHCTGTGTWTYDAGAGPWPQKVEVSVDDCAMDTWEVFGTAEDPKLFVYIGDPDSWDLYVLRRGDPREAASAADMMREVFETDVFGVARVTHAFLPLQRRSASPVVVDVSSGLGSIAAMTDPDRPAAAYPGVAYPASKTALDMVTVQYAKALPGMRINAVEPGFTKTDLNGNTGTQTVAEGAEIIVRMARLGPGGPSRGYFDAAGPLPW